MIIFMEGSCIIIESLSFVGGCEFFSAIDILLLDVVL